jgi:hypothetical protein
MERRPAWDTIPSMNDGRPAVIGRESIRMQATGLKTTQPAYNRSLIAALLAVVVLAAIVSALIIVTSGRIGTADPAAAPAPNAITRAPVYGHDLPEAASGAVSGGNVYDTSQNRAQFLGQTGSSTGATPHRLPLGGEGYLNATGASSAPRAVNSPRRMIAK